MAFFALNIHFSPSHLINIIQHVDSITRRGHNILGGKKNGKKSSKKIKKVLDIWGLGCYYSQALDGRDTKEPRPRAKECTL